MVIDRPVIWAWFNDEGVHERLFSDRFAVVFCARRRYSHFLTFNHSLIFHKQILEWNTIARVDNICHLADKKRGLIFSLLSSKKSYMSFDIFQHNDNPGISYG